jgi:hypothetical protein
MLLKIQWTIRIDKKFKNNLLITILKLLNELH